jgi:hypothetical protein
MAINRKVTIEIGGEHYAGDWTTENGLIAVRPPGYGCTSTQL